MADDNSNTATKGLSMISCYSSPSTSPEPQSTPPTPPTHTGTSPTQSPSHSDPIPTYQPSSPTKGVHTPDPESPSTCGSVGDNNTTSTVHLPTDNKGDQEECVSGTKPEVATLTGSEVATVVGPDVATVIGPDVASVKGPDVASVVGPDVATVKRPDVATVIGPDVATVKGPGVASVVGPDVATVIGPGVASVIGPDDHQSITASNVEPMEESQTMQSFDLSKSINDDATSGSMMVETSETSTCDINSCTITTVGRPLSPDAASDNVMASSEQEPMEVERVSSNEVKGQIEVTKCQSTDQVQLQQEGNEIMEIDEIQNENVAEDETDEIQNEADEIRNEINQNEADEINQNEADEIRKEVDKIQDETDEIRNEANEIENEAEEINQNRPDEIQTKAGEIQNEASETMIIEPLQKVQSHNPITNTIDPDVNTADSIPTTHSTDSIIKDTISLADSDTSSANPIVTGNARAVTYDNTVNPDTNTVDPDTSTVNPDTNSVDHVVDPDTNMVNPNVDADPYISAVDPDINIVDPNTNVHVVDSDTNVVDPNAVDSDTNAVDPDINTVDPDTSRVDPDPSTVDPDSNTVDPDINTVDPDINTVNPDINAVNTDSNTVDPFTNIAESDINANTDAVDPNITVDHVGDSDFNAVDPDTDTVDPDPNTVDPDTDTVDPDTDTFDPDTDTVDPDTDTVDPDTDTVDPDPIDEKVDSGVNVVDSYTNAADPDTSIMDENDTVDSDANIVDPDTNRVDSDADTFYPAVDPDADAVDPDTCTYTVDSDTNTVRLAMSMESSGHGNQDKASSIDLLPLNKCSDNEVIRVKDNAVSNTKGEHSRAHIGNVEDFSSIDEAQPEGRSDETMNKVEPVGKQVIKSVAEQLPSDDCGNDKLPSGVDVTATVTMEAVDRGDSTTDTQIEDTTTPMETEGTNMEETEVKGVPGAMETEAPMTYTPESMEPEDSDTPVQQEDTAAMETEDSVASPMETVATTIPAESESTPIEANNTPDTESAGTTIITGMKAFDPVSQPEVVTSCSPEAAHRGPDTVSDHSCTGSIDEDTSEKEESDHDGDHRGTRDQIHEPQEVTGGSEDIVQSSNPTTIECNQQELMKVADLQEPFVATEEDGLTTEVPGDHVLPDGDPFGVDMKGSDTGEGLCSNNDDVQEGSGNRVSTPEPVETTQERDENIVMPSISVHQRSKELVHEGSDNIKQSVEIGSSKEAVNIESEGGKGSGDNIQEIVNEELSDIEKPISQGSSDVVEPVKTVDGLEDKGSARGDMAFESQVIKGSIVDGVPLKQADETKELVPEMSVIRQLGDQSSDNVHEGSVEVLKGSGDDENPTSEKDSDDEDTIDGDDEDTIDGDEQPLMNEQEGCMSPVRMTSEDNQEQQMEDNSQTLKVPGNVKTPSTLIKLITDPLSMTSHSSPSSTAVSIVHQPAPISTGTSVTNITGTSVTNITGTSVGASSWVRLPPLPLPFNPVSSHLFSSGITPELMPRLQPLPSDQEQPIKSTPISSTTPDIRLLLSKTTPSIFSTLPLSTTSGSIAMPIPSGSLPQSFKPKSSLSSLLKSDQKQSRDRLTIMSNSQGLSSETLNTGIKPIPSVLPLTSNQPSSTTHQSVSTPVDGTTCSTGGVITSLKHKKHSTDKHSLLSLPPPVIHPVSVPFSTKPPPSFHSWTPPTLSSSLSSSSQTILMTDLYQKPKNNNSQEISTSKQQQQVISGSSSEDTAPTVFSGCITSSSIASVPKFPSKPSSSLPLPTLAPPPFVTPALSSLLQLPLSSSSCPVSSHISTPSAIMPPLQLSSHVSPATTILSTSTTTINNTSSTAAAVTMATSIHLPVVRAPIVTIPSPAVEGTTTGPLPQSEVLSMTPAHMFMNMAPPSLSSSDVFGKSNILRSSSSVIMDEPIKESTFNVKQEQGGGEGISEVDKVTANQLKLAQQKLAALQKHSYSQLARPADLTSFEYIGSDSQGIVYWYDGGRNMYQSPKTLDHSKKLKDSDISLVCKSFVQWQNKLKQLRSSCHEADSKLAQTIKEAFLPRVKVATKRKPKDSSSPVTMTTTTPATSSRNTSPTQTSTTTSVSNTSSSSLLQQQVGPLMSQGPIFVVPPNLLQSQCLPMLPVFANTAVIMPQNVQSHHPTAVGMETRSTNEDSSVEGKSEGVTIVPGLTTVGKTDKHSTGGGEVTIERIEIHGGEDNTRPSKRERTPPVGGLKTTNVKDYQQLLSQQQLQLQQAVAVVSGGNPFIKHHSNPLTSSGSSSTLSEGGVKVLLVESEAVMGQVDTHTKSMEILGEVPIRLVTREESRSRPEGVLPRSGLSTDDRPGSYTRPGSHTMSDDRPGSHTMSHNRPGSHTNTDMGSSLTKQSQHAMSSSEGGVVGKDNTAPEQGHTPHEVMSAEMLLSLHERETESASPASVQQYSSSRFLPYSSVHAVPKPIPTTATQSAPTASRGKKNRKQTPVASARVVPSTMPSNHGNQMPTQLPLKDKPDNKTDIKKDGNRATSSQFKPVIQPQSVDGEVPKQQPPSTLDSSNTNTSVSTDSSFNISPNKSAANRRRPSKTTPTVSSTRGRGSANRGRKGSVRQVNNKAGSSAGGRGKAPQSARMMTSQPLESDSDSSECSTSGTGSESSSEDDDSGSPSPVKAPPRGPPQGTRREVVSSEDSDDDSDDESSNTDNDDDVVMESSSKGKGRGGRGRGGARGGGRTTTAQRLGVQKGGRAPKGKVEKLKPLRSLRGTQVKSTTKKPSSQAAQKTTGTTATTQQRKKATNTATPSTTTSRRKQQPTVTSLIVKIPKKLLQQQTKQTGSRKKRKQPPTASEEEPFSDDDILPPQTKQSRSSIDKGTTTTRTRRKSGLETASTDKPILSDLSSFYKAQGVDLQTLSELTGDDKSISGISRPTTTRSKRTCVRVREGINKLQEILDTSGVGGAKGGSKGSSGKGGDSMAPLYSNPYVGKKRSRHSSTGKNRQQSEVAQSSSQQLHDKHGPSSKHKTKYYFSTHMVNSAADAVWRGKMETILEFHKTQTRNDGGFLSPPHKQYSTSATSSDSEPEEKAPTPPPPQKQPTTTRGGKGRGRRGRRGRGGARAVGTRRSNRLAKVESSDEDNGQSSDEPEVKQTPAASKKRQRPSTPPVSSNEGGTSDEDNSYRSPKHPKYGDTAVTMTTTSPLSSPRSDVSQDDSPEPSSPPTQKGTTTGRPGPVEQQLAMGAKSRQTGTTSPVVVVTNEPHQQTPLSVTTPDSTPLQHPPAEEMNYTIAHSTPEAIINPSPSSSNAMSMRSNNLQQQQDYRPPTNEGMATTRRVEQTRTHPSNATPTPQELDKSTVNVYQPQPTQGSSGGWHHQFMQQGGYPYNPKLHPMAAYHTPQGMMPSNYPYTAVPYPWPHPPQSSHPEQQMRVGSFPVSTPPTYPTGTQPIGGAGEGAWPQQQQKRKKESSGASGKKSSGSSGTSTPSAPVYQEHVHQKNVGVASLHQQHIDSVSGHHGNSGRVITSSPASMQQYYHQSQQQPMDTQQPPSAAAGTAFQYGFDSRHAHFNPATAHMWQSPHAQHPAAAAQLHPLMSHHLAQQGLWYAQQNPQQVGMATMPHPQSGGIDNRTVDSKGRKGPG